MGRGVALSLARAGLEVSQFDLDAAALKASAGQHEAIRGAKSIADCCAGSAAVAVTVSNEKAERAVFLGESGVFRNVDDDAVVLNLGTTSVQWARELHAAATTPFLDAPVSGGPEGAATASLTVMLGGSSENVDRAAFLLEAIAKKYERLGGPGAGAAAKLVNQQLVAANAHAAGEAFALAFALGCDLTKLSELLSQSWGHSTMFARVATTAIPFAESLAPLLEHKSAAPLRNFVKDVSLVREAAESAGVSATCLAPAAEVLRDCEARDLLDVDWAAVSALASEATSLTSLERKSPPPIQDDVAEGYRADIQERAARAGVVPVVDDDPTGTQTVNGVNVLSYPWREADVDAEVSSRGNCFFVLANTRALPEGEAAARALEIGRVLREKSPSLRCVASRSDSTLRGHYPAEVDALAEGLGWDQPLVVVAPFFFEGGRVTANDVHYVADLTTGALTPCAETEFAKDAAFGYEHSDLKDWVRAKDETGRTSVVATISLADLRRGGPDAVAAKLVAAATSSSSRRVVVANALDTNDASCLALGLLRAEERLFSRDQTSKGVSGIIMRCAASLVAARCAIRKKPLLTAADLFPPQEAPRHGLVVVGSYVGKTSRQLDALLSRAGDTVVRVELSAEQCAASDSVTREAEVSRVVDAVDAGFREGKVVVVHTSRQVVRRTQDQDQHASSLLVGDRINDAVCRVVSEVFEKKSAKNAFVVAKGGITSNDVAVKALGVRRAEVLGQVVPGVPAWRLGPETKLPGAPYVVFPGNVGTDDDLANVVDVVSDGSGIEKISKKKSSPPKPVAFGTERLVAKELLLEARRRGRAVGAFNLYNLEGAVAVRNAVDATGLPAIVQFHPASMAFGGTALIAACQDLAAGAPMLVALDHADDADVIRRAVDRGVDYVMADGSGRSYEDNVAWTAQIKEDVARGVAVEAELGRLAGEEDGLSVREKDAKMTDPDVVADFVRRTRIDALAVTIGNVHGPYKSASPELDWPRLERIRQQVPDDLPLVLHGASGLPLPLLHRAIAAGVCKFNVNTEVRHASKLAIRKAAAETNKDVLDIMKDSVAAMTPVVTAKLRAFAP